MGLSCFKSWKHDSTGHKGNRDVLASPGSYFFLSNSAGQGDEWLKSLNKGVWIPFTGVFGQRLEETVLYERRYGMRLVPLVVEQCVNFIRERGLREVGLFRQPGQASLVKELQQAFDAGERPSFDSSTDVHTVASLLKLYLRQLPEPLVPHSRYQDFLLCGQRLRTDRTQGLGDLRTLLHELPVANFNLLNFICQFLSEVQSYSGSNKMSDQNLATVFGPNILRAKAEDPQSIMGGAALVHVLMLELIREHESLFAKVAPHTSNRPPGASHVSPSALRQLHLQPSPCLRQLSMPLIAERSGDPGQAEAEAEAGNSSCALLCCRQFRLVLGSEETSWSSLHILPPRELFLPLASSSQSHGRDYQQHHAGEGPSPANTQASSTSLQLQDPLPDTSKPRLTLMEWAKAWPGSGEPDAGFWSSGAAEEGGGAGPGTASGGSSESQERSTPSAYDNLDTVSLHPRMEDVSGAEFEPNDPGGHIGPCEEEAELEEVEQTRGSSSSWSSCEVLPLDESGDACPHTSPKKPKRLPSIQPEEENGDNREDLKNNNDPDGRDDVSAHHPNSPASCSVLSDSLLSTGSSEVFLPSGPPDLQGPEPESREAQSLLAELQKQMAQQKAEYQARIQRLERCNHVLERQVEVLRVTLEQQKRSQSVAEIKIRNMEQAKADADRRNSTLQREMELFFQMYGEIRRRGGQGGRGGSL